MPRVSFGLAHRLKHAFASPVILHCRGRLSDKGGLSHYAFFLLTIEYSLVKVCARLVAKKLYCTHTSSRSKREASPSDITLGIYDCGKDILRSFATLCRVSSFGVATERKTRIEEIVRLSEASLGTNAELRA